MHKRHTTSNSGATRILHVLDHSLPEQSGYASRSHAILTSLAALGLPVEAITSPKHGPSATGEDTIDAVRYLRTPAAGRTDGVSGQVATVRWTRRRIRQHIRHQNVSLIHAHSPCLNGLASIGLGRPLVYEMRSSWEDAAVSSGTTEEGSVRYRLSRLLETAAVRQAHAVTVICEGLKRELIGRGIAEHKITVVPNALPPAMFEPSDPERSDALRRRFGLQDKRVIGFFGSFFEWEGVDKLVRAMPDVVAALPDARLLLAGGGRQEADLLRLAGSLGLSNAVIFAGRVGASVMRDFYGAADLMVYPRISHRLTEMVTPLKPLEAMAQGRPVVASDVGGHRELIENGRTGFLYPVSDPDALAARIIEVLNSGSRIEEVTRAARLFVEQERRWSVVCEKYLHVYEQLLAGAPEAAGT